MIRALSDSPEAELGHRAVKEGCRRYGCSRLAAFVAVAGGGG